MKMKGLIVVMVLLGMMAAGVVDSGLLVAEHEEAMYLSDTGKVYMMVTAYSDDDGSIDVPEWRDGLTASGKKVRRGLIAADWRIFPPGTLLHVPGYGMAQVEDKGGKIKGLKLDLYMDDVSEAFRWGVKVLEITVIGQATPKS